MVEQAPNPVAGVDDSGEDESEGVDLERIREMTGFVLRSSRRHPVIALVTFVTVAALGLTVAFIAPRTYSSEVKLLAQRPSTIRMLSGSNVWGMDAVDNPTRNISAMILRHDNIVTLVKEGNLVRRFEETREPALKLKDRALAWVFGPPSDDAKFASMVALLEGRLDVETDEGASLVKIRVDWPNPQIAYDLVTLVQKNFLEARFDSDVGVINDSISVLEDRAKEQLQRVDAELEAYQKLLTERAKASPSAVARVAAVRAFVATRPRPAATAALPEVVDPDLARDLEEKRREIRALEEAQQRLADGLRQELMQAQLTLTPLHPKVIALRERLEAVSLPPPELEQLRLQERSLSERLAAKASTWSAPSVSPALAPVLRTDGPSSSPAPSADPLSTPIVDSDGPLQLAQSRLGSAIHSYQDTVGRIDSARADLEITRATYRYKYTVMSPAGVPSKPIKATGRLIGAAALLGGAALGILLAALSDVLSGRVLETWQVRRRLKLDVLAELDDPS